MEWDGKKYEILDSFYRENWEKEDGFWVKIVIGILWLCGLIDKI